MGDVACCNFVRDVSVGFEPFDDEPVLDSLFEQYGRVIVQSMITSFGLDFLVADRHGGDVDTIHNVRQVGIDSEMTYKNSDNLRSYEERGPYDSSAYHSHCYSGTLCSWSCRCCYAAVRQVRRSFRRNRRRC